MKKPTLICIHGYGLRGFFWENFIKNAHKHAYEVACPDLQMMSPDQSIAEILHIVLEEANKNPHGIILIGHSMGAILSALAAQKIDHSILKGALFIACPYGSRNAGRWSLVRYLLSRKLIPAYFIRQRFFGPHIKDKTRKAIFAKAVKENETFRNVINAEEWFHNKLLRPLQEIPTLVVSSEADRIVPSSQSAEFAKKLGCKHIAIPASRKIGHDDFGVSDEANNLILELVAMLGSSKPDNIA